MREQTANRTVALYLDQQHCLSLATIGPMPIQRRLATRCKFRGQIIGDYRPWCYNALHLLELTWSLPALHVSRRIVARHPRERTWV